MGGLLHSIGLSSDKGAEKNGEKTCMHPEDIDEIDGEGRNVLMSIISQLGSGSELSRITLPTFILEPRSMLERITNQLQHPQLLFDARAASEPVTRFVNVVRWYLSGWHVAPKAVKKPLNPILGEFFTAWWDLGNLKAYYVAEQTSHHPPKSSYFYTVPDKHIRVDGTLVPRSQFLGNSVASFMEGIGYLCFQDINETYELTQPNMYARGILIGSLKYELGDVSTVRCESLDLIAEIEFKTKGFISGTYNVIHGVIKNISTSKPLFEITGKWNEVMYIAKADSGSPEVFFDATSAQPIPPRVRPLEVQAWNESRKLWHNVISAIVRRDHRTAKDEKSRVEDAQRQRARDHDESGEPFVPVLFAPEDSRLQFRLRTQLSGSPQQQTQQLLSAVPIVE